MTKNIKIKGIRKNGYNYLSYEGVLLTLYKMKKFNYDISEIIEFFEDLKE